jgi:predicted CoA-binding protein
VADAPVRQISLEERVMSVLLGSMTLQRVDIVSVFLEEAWAWHVIRGLVSVSVKRMWLVVCAIDVQSMHLTLGRAILMDASCAIVTQTVALVHHVIN